MFHQLSLQIRWCANNSSQIAVDGMWPSWSGSIGGALARLLSVMRNERLRERGSCSLGMRRLRRFLTADFSYLVGWGRDRLLSGQGEDEKQRRQVAKREILAACKEKHSSLRKWSCTGKGAQGGCSISTRGDTGSSAGHSPEWPDLTVRTALPSGGGQLTRLSKVPTDDQKPPCEIHWGKDRQCRAQTGVKPMTDGENSIFSF